MSSPSAHIENQQTLVIVRLAIGLAQGAVLFALYKAWQLKVWPATDGFIFAPLATIAIFVPFIAAAGLSNLRVRSLMIWIAAAAALCAALGFYDIFRDPTSWSWSEATPSVFRVLPSAALWLGLTVVIFIGHSLIEAGDTDRSFIARYSKYHDTSWKLGVQHTLAFLFVGIFWGLLWLGAALFTMIGVRFFQNLIIEPWFYIPITALAISAAIHLTDVRAGIVRGTRVLGLHLLSWLLPVMVVIAAGFLLALPFTGLEPLWKTRRATSLLLTAAVALIVLINCAYQDDQTEKPPARILIYARLVAVVVLAAIVGLAGYGLWLRVEQYGWSPARIIALACIVVAAFYAIGYLAAAIHDRMSLRGLEITNIATAFAICAVLVALLTPIADPARISVADQLKRLSDGTLTAANFDFDFLRFKSGRYGTQALDWLARNENGAQEARIAAKAKEAMTWTRPGLGVLGGPARIVGDEEARRQRQPIDRAANITVITAGQTMPESFLEKDWRHTPRQFVLPQCLTMANQKCNAVFADLDGDGAAEILLFPAASGQAGAFQSSMDGSWSFIGSIQNTHCAGVRDAVRAGNVQLAAPAFKELAVGGHRLRVHADCAPSTP